MSPLRNFAMLLLIAALFGAAQARADLQVFPTRVVLSARKPTDRISLKHASGKEMQYRVSAIYYKMKPDGSMDLVPDPGLTERSAIGLIRFSPRQVTLRPGEQQVVRVMARPTGQLTDGDYRAHLHFEPIGSPDGDLAKGPVEGAVTTQLNVRLAVAVPIIYRNGKTEGKVRLENLSVGLNSKGQTAFQVELFNDGNEFPYGAFQITFTDAKGTVHDVGLIRGISSYLPMRVVSFPLTLPSGLTIANGKLTAKFKDGDAVDGKVYAQAEIVVP